MIVLDDFFYVLERNGGDDWSRPCCLCRDSERLISTFKDLQEHGRHRKSLQGSPWHRNCVPRSVPRPAANRSYRDSKDWTKSERGPAISLRSRRRCVGNGTELT